MFPTVTYIFYHIYQLCIHTDYTEAGIKAPLVEP